MSPLRLRAAAGIVAALVISVFVLSAPRAKDGAELDARQSASVAQPTLALRESIKKGVRTITAVVTVPDACTEATAEVSEQEGALVVAIVTTPSEGVCLKVPTSKSLTLTSKASSELPLRATVNGVSVTTTP